MDLLLVNFFFEVGPSLLVNICRTELFMCGCGSEVQRLCIYNNVILKKVFVFH